VMLEAFLLLKDIRNRPSRGAAGHRKASDDHGRP